MSSREETDISIHSRRCLPHRVTQQISLRFSLAEEERPERKRSQRVTPEACRDFSSFFHEEARVDSVRRFSRASSVLDANELRGKP